MVSHSGAVCSGAMAAPRKKLRDSGRNPLHFHHSSGLALGDNVPPAFFQVDEVAVSGRDAISIFRSSLSHSPISGPDPALAAGGRRFQPDDVSPAAAVHPDAHA